jgi:hypothetical protein
MLLFTTLASVAAADLAGAQSATPAPSVGIVTHLSGVLTVRHPDGSTKVLGVKSEIHEGDLLVTQQNTYTRIKFVDDAEMVVRPQSQVLIESYVYDADHEDGNKVAVRLVNGGLRAVTGLIGKHNHDAVRLATPDGEIQVRGTNYGALFCQNDCGSVPTPSGAKPQNGLYVDVSQGAVMVTNSAGQQVFQVGQFGYVAGPTTPPIILPPSQGVPVTMPLSISKNAPPGPPAGGQGQVDCIVQ